MGVRLTSHPDVTNICLGNNVPGLGQAGLSVCWPQLRGGQPWVPWRGRALATGSKKMVADKGRVFAHGGKDYQAGRSPSLAGRHTLVVTRFLLFLATSPTRFRSVLGSCRGSMVGTKRAISSHSARYQDGIEATDGWLTPDVLGLERHNNAERRIHPRKTNPACRCNDVYEVGQVKIGLPRSEVISLPRLAIALRT